MDPKFPAIPDSLRALMAEVGPRWGTNPAAHVKLMIDQFSEVLKHAPKSGVDRPQRHRLRISPTASHRPVHA